MNGLLEYAIESSICLTILWIFYEIALKRDTRHGRNRYWLLGSMLFSVIVPLLNIRIGAPGGILPPGGLVSVLLPEAVVTPDGSSSRTGLMSAIPDLIYPVGLLISAGLMFSGTVRLVKLIYSFRGKGNVIRLDSDNGVCFSALGHIFISNSLADEDAERMINHEKKHIRLGHHTDLFIAGLITALQWFNPAAYLMRRSLLAVHEYEADSECITGGEDPGSYRELLLSSVFRSRVPIFSNTFSKRSLLKNRIIMMTKKRTGSSASLKMILALPLALVLVFMFSCNSGSDARLETANELEATTVTKSASDVADNGTSDEIFSVVDQMPVFRNDTTYKELFSWMAQNMKYPAEASSNGIQGKVIVTFVIDEKGNVKDPKVIRSVDPILDQAALELVAACPQWAPGKQNGKVVKVAFTLPITYALN